MPGFTTHYLFGLNTYKALKNDSLKKTIYDHHAAYSLGLQGPDVFFYYLPSYVLHGKNIGSLAHAKATGTFLSNLLESRSLFPDKTEADIAYAYIMGFLGHYLLDCRCHPYVYWRTHYKGDIPGYYGDHMNLETDIDTELLSLFKSKKPSDFRQESTIMLTRPEVRTIATILYYVYSTTYPDLKISYIVMRQAIRAMQIGLHLLHDPHGKKKVVIRKAESRITGYPVLSPMIASDYLLFFADPLNVLHREWHNPWDKEQTSTASFLELLDSAQADYQKLLRQVHHLFHSDKHSDEEKLRQAYILETLGNNSYHSGMEPEAEQAP